MSLQATPNQPLDWQLLPLGDAECPDCPPSDYCSPMLFERYADGIGDKYYRSVDYFSFSIEGSLDEGDMCQIEQNDATNVNVNADGALSSGGFDIAFGPTSIGTPASLITFQKVVAIQGCPLVVFYCLDWDTSCEGCESSRDYPITVTVQVQGSSTPIQTQDIIVQSPSELQKCSKIIFSDIQDSLISLTITATEAVPATKCEPEGAPCTAAMRVETFSICNVVPLEVVTANGTANDWGGAFNLIHYNFGTIDGETYYITGVYQIDGIPEVAVIGNSAFSTYVENCMKIKLQNGDCCGLDYCIATFESVCIKPVLDPCGTVRVEYYQDTTPPVGAKPGEDAFGFGFYYPATSPTFTQHMRLPGNVRDAKYDGTMISYQDSLGRKRVVYAERRKALSFNTGRVPEYVHDALSLACRHDNFLLEDALYSVDDNFFTRTTEYTPTYIRMSRLAPVSLEVEAKTQDLKKNMCI